MEVSTTITAINHCKLLHLVIKCASTYKHTHAHSCRNTNKETKTQKQKGVNKIIIIWRESEPRVNQPRVSEERERAVWPLLCYLAGSYASLRTIQCARCAGPSPCGPRRNRPLDSQLYTLQSRPTTHVSPVQRSMMMGDGLMMMTSRRVAATVHQ